MLSAAVAEAEAGGLRLLNYRDFPETAIETVLGWTGRGTSAGDRARLAEAATFDAKTPVLPFQAQPASNQTLSAAARAAVLRFAQPAFVTLERLRADR
jgi:hypothetical protein